MAIVQNVSDELGDRIIIQVEVPIIGLIALNSFIDTTEGETGTSFFLKEFRFSVDGLNFSEWKELTQSNLDETEIDAQGSVTFEYRYTHSGSSNDPISYSDSLLVGQIVETGGGIYYDYSVFGKYFSAIDTEVLNWGLNVTEKAYLQGGIVPMYIPRNTEDSTNIDQDYLAFWRSVALFFAYFTKFIKTITSFSSNVGLLYDYLKDLGVFLGKSHSLQELIYLTNNYFTFMRHRGTMNIIRKKNDVNILSHGELLRLIDYNPVDEFIFNLHPPEHSGWVINNNSPLYKGTHYSPNINKSYTKEEDIDDLEPFPIVGEEFIDLVTDSGHSVLQISEVTNGNISGIYPTFETSIPIDPNINYEISFFVKHSSLANNFTFSIEGYDVNGNVITMLNAENGAPRNVFLENYTFIRNDVWYRVKGIIYNKDTPDLGLNNSLLNINAGRKLRFNENVNNIAVRIYIDGQGGNASNNIKIYGLKIQPASFGFGNGYIQLPNLITLWFKNRNNVYSVDQIKEIIKKYLIPYNAVLIPIFLQPGELPEAEEPIVEDIILLNQDTVPLLNEDTGYIILEYANAPPNGNPTPPSGNNAYPAAYPFAYQ